MNDYIRQIMYRVLINSLITPPKIEEVLTTIHVLWDYSSRVYIRYFVYTDFLMH